MNRIMKGLKKDSSKEKQKASKKRDYIQNWLPIEDISHGMIIWKEGILGKRYIKVIEVSPINFHLHSAREQAAIIDQFYSWIKTAPGKFQLCVTSLDVDIADMIVNIRRKTLHETSALKIERNKYIQKIESLSVKEAIRKRCLIVFEYEGGKDGMRANDIETISKQMMETVYNLRNMFNKMGNRIALHENENEFLMEILYRYMNKKSIQTVPFDERVERIEADSVLIQKSNNPTIDVKDYFLPRGLDTNNPNYIIMDGVYHTYLYFNSEQYPIHVFGGWIDDVVGNYGDRVDLSLHFEKKDRAIVLNNLKRGMRFNLANSNDKSDDEDAVENLTAAYATSAFIKRKLKEENEDLYEACLIMDVMASSLEELQKIKATIKSDLVGNDIGMGDCFARCEDAAKMVLPFNYISKPIMNRSKRNFLTSSIASTYPFTQYEMFDANGVLFGLNGYNSTLVSANIFNTNRFRNANGVILGSSGSGKTYLEQLLGRHMRLTGTKVMYVLPMKGHEYRRGCKQLGGQYIKLAPGAKTCINLFEIRPSENVDEILIEGSAFEKGSLLSKKLTQIKTFIQLLLKTELLSVIEENLIDEYLISMYSDFEITHNDASIFTVDKEGKSCLKTMPTFTSFSKKIEVDQRMERIKACLLPFLTGSCSNMNGQTNIDLTNKYIVFDVDADDIPISLHPAFLFIGIDICYSIIKQSRTEECVLFLDEVWKMMINEFAASFVYELIKIVRGYAGSCIVATQDIGDFFSFADGRYGKSIINNAVIKIILSMEHDSVEYIQDILKLNDNEKKEIETYEPGSGMLISNKDRLSIFFKSTQEEMETFTTDGKQLRKIAKRERMKAEAMKEEN